MIVPVAESGTEAAAKATQIVTRALLLLGSGDAIAVGTAEQIGVSRVEEGQRRTDTVVVAVVVVIIGRHEDFGGEYEPALTADGPDWYEGVGLDNYCGGEIAVIEKGHDGRDGRGWIPHDREEQRETAMENVAWWFSVDRDCFFALFDLASPSLGLQQNPFCLASLSASSSRPFSRPFNSCSSLSEQSGMKRNDPSL